MLPDAMLPVPASLASLLAVFGPLFTAPSFRTFCGLACGFLSQAGERTVCGMLAGVGACPGSGRTTGAHRFFARARWNADDLGPAAARLVVALLVPAGEPVVVAIDDTLFRRRRQEGLGRLLVPRRVRAGTCENGVRQHLGDHGHRGEAARPPPASGHPGAGQAGHQGHELRLPAVAGPPHGTDDRRRAARPPHPRRGRFGLRRARAKNCRLPELDHPAAKDAALHGLPPASACLRGPPRTKGDRLPCLAKLAAATAFTQVTVTRYGKAATISAAAVTCLWPSVFDTCPVAVVLIRDRSAAGE